MITAIKKFLGWLGLPYCQKCGSRLVVTGYRGYDEIEIYECPNSCK